MVGSICSRISQKLHACLIALACLWLVVVFAMSHGFTPCINDNVSAVSVWKENVIEAPLNLQITSNLNKCNQLYFCKFNNQVIEKFCCVLRDFNENIWLFYKPVFKDREVSKFYFKQQSCSVYYDVFKFIFCIKSGCKRSVESLSLLSYGTSVNSLSFLYYCF